MENFERLKIGYLLNPDKVFLNEMDDELVNLLRERGVEVITFSLEEIAFSITIGIVDILIRNEKTNMDGFLSYGYMSKFHYDSYLYVIETICSIGIPCLYTMDQEIILGNKYLQALSYSKNSIPIPMTQLGFSIPTFRHLANSYLPNKSILKRMLDFGGDGVNLMMNKDFLINVSSKLLWDHKYCIFQEFIDDSVGRSIRVLCINGKGISCAEYIDKTNHFKSNNGFTSEYYSLESLMDSPKLNDYYEIAEKAVSAIGKLIIAGVDIIDSNKNGLSLLEVNAWPDIFDISEMTNIDGSKLFIDAYCMNVQGYKQRKLTEK
jgi:glutathione synthase/RimK-type ligase-like ATP-grasp enzyme